MRSSILGAYFADDAEQRREFVFASSRLTHRGWQAETAALAVAESVALAVRTPASSLGVRVLERLRVLSEETEWQAILVQIESSLAANLSVSEFVRTLGLARGVTGYALHVVPVAVYAWLRHPADFRTALISALECGGDTDTVGAILGAMTGASVGKRGIPGEWLDDIADWPRSVGFMERVGAKLAEQKVAGGALGPVGLCWPGLLLRNLLFLVVVLGHGFRRLVPL